MSDPQIDFIVADLARYTESQVVDLSLNVVANLQEDTPRDTGWARANWVPSLGAPYEEDVGSGGSVSLAQAKQSTGIAQVVGFRLSDGSVFATNNVPYIQALNDGSSSQAGAAFVQASVERAVDQTARNSR